MPCRARAFVVAAGIAACGESLPETGVDPNRRDASPSDGASGNDGEAPDAGAGDAGSTFCSRASGFVACEDFETEPAKQGWQTFASGGLALETVPGDPLGGRAGRVDVGSIDAGLPAPPYARLSRAIAGGGTAYHLELVAKVDHQGTGDLPIANLAMRGNDATLKVEILSQSASTKVLFCGNPCEVHDVTDSLTSWTSLVLDVSSDGVMSARIGGVLVTASPLPPLVTVVDGSANVGVVSALEGGRRVVTFDDALLTKK